VNTHRAEQVANAILYEGYVLYPYRASAPKNQARWQIGLIVPRAFADAAGSDPSFVQTECIAELRPGARLTLRVRGLQPQGRTVEERVDGDGPSWRPVADLTVGARRLVAWDEAVACEFRRENIVLDDAQDLSWDWTLEPWCAIEEVEGTDGTPAARLTRSRREVQLRIRLVTRAEPPFLRMLLRVENLTPSSARSLAERHEALEQSLAGTHSILALEGARFESLLEPSPAAATLVARCTNAHTFPVLADSPGSRQVLLSSPVILYDYPAVAPESSGELFDSTEIDELLTLRVRTLTDAEKAEARATDPLAAAVIERCDAASPSDIGSLHGAVRGFETFLNPPDEPSPEEGSVCIDGVLIRRGSQVRLRPVRVADSLDLCLSGRTATVAAVYRTLEDDPYVAVSLDDDPFGAEGIKYRRALFFRPEELVPLVGQP